MAKWDLTDLEREISDLQDLVAKVREVNAAQAEQLRKAQERIRAAEAERDRAWNEAIEAAASDLESVGDVSGYNAEKFWREYERNLCIDRIRSLAKEAGK